MMSNFKHFKNLKRLLINQKYLSKHVPQKISNCHYNFLLLKHFTNLICFLARAPQGSTLGLSLLLHYIIDLPVDVIHNIVT